MKILASDYDGTLHFKDGYHKEDIEAIRRFQEAGHLFGLCSGRALGNLSQLEKEDGLHFDFLIGASGAALSAGGRIIYEKTIPYEVFEGLYERMNGHHLFVETKKDTYAVKEDFSFFPWIDPILDLTDPEVLKNEDIVHASIEFETEAELYAVLPKIEDLKDQIEFYQMDCRSILFRKVSPKNRDRADGKAFQCRGSGHGMHWRQLQRSADDYRNS